MARYQFTSESVTEGHPDKVCDQVSDAILDGILAQDTKARVACESLAKTGMVVVAGEITTSAWVDIPSIVRSTVREIGYTHSSMGFDADTCAVLTAIEKQSPDISQGVTEGEGLHKEQGAGDQGLMFGYATDETPNLMPAPIDYAHQLARQLAQIRKAAKVNFLRPDGKTQVTLEYENDEPVRIDAVVVSTQHDDAVKYKTLRDAVMELVVEKVLPKKLIDKNTKFHVNPTGRFVIGGPLGDCGLTGRKIIVDSYGGMGRHGGGAFSGKDPSKVDRSACYYARFVAKNVVAAGLARRCEVQVAYAIGVARPVGVHVNTFGTGKIADERLERYIIEHFDMRPKALIDELDLLRPIYKATAAYGHFGRAEFSWEKTNRAAVMAADLLGGKVRGTKIESLIELAPDSTNGTNGSANANKKDKKAKGKAGKKNRKKGKTLFVVHEAPPPVEGEKAKRGIPLVVRLIAAIVLGCVVGYFAGPRAEILGELGILVIKMLKALATPLVFFAVVDSFCRAKIPAKKGVVLFVICVVNAAVAGALAIGLSGVIEPGKRTHIESLTATLGAGAAAAPAPLKMDPLSAAKDLVPESVVEPLLKNNVLAVVLLAVLAGIALRALRARGSGETLFRVIEEGFALLALVLEGIIQVVPFAVFGVVAKVVGTTGFAIFVSLGALVGTVTLGLAIHVIVYYGLLVVFIARMSPLRFFRAASEALVTAMSTGSSMATLPITLKTLEKKLGVSHGSARLAACVGTNFNNDGIMLYEVVAALFIAQLYGIDLGAGQKISLAITSALAAAGIAGVPEAGLITLSLVLTSVGLPISALPVLLTVDWLLGRLRATTNVTSDLLVATMLDRLGGRHGDEVAIPAPVPVRSGES